MSTDNTDRIGGWGTACQNIGEERMREYKLSAYEFLHSLVELIEEDPKADVSLIDRIKLSANEVVWNGTSPEKAVDWFENGLRLALELMGRDLDVAVLEATNSVRYMLYMLQDRSQNIRFAEDLLAADLLFLDLMKAKDLGELQSNLKKVSEVYFDLTRPYRHL